MTDQHTAEEWRDIPGYAGAYQVSNRGNVRSLTRTARSGRTIPGQRIQPQAGERGHLRVHFRQDGRRAVKSVHRLVLEAFVGPCPDGMQACHNNGDPTDNRVGNLRWDTSSANRLDSVKHGTHWAAAKTACKRGHPFIEQNLEPWSRRNGARNCLACKRESRESYKQGRPFDPARADANYAQIAGGAAA